MVIRNGISSMNDYVSKLCEYNSTNSQQKDYTMNNFYSLYLSNRTNMLASSIYAYLLDENSKDYYTNLYPTKIALYSLVVVGDLYIKLNHDFVTGKLTKENDRLSRMITKAMESKETNMLLSDIKNISKFVQATLEFMDASTYQKIAYLSALDEDDIKILSEFNPFFKEEYDHFNVPLDEDFLIRQISKWLNGNNNIDTSLEKCAEFIIDMSYSDPDKIDNIIDLLASYTDMVSKLEDAIADGNIEFLKGILNTFYQENKEKNLKR